MKIKEEHQTMLRSCIQKLIADKGTPAFAIHFTYIEAESKQKDINVLTRFIWDVYWACGKVESTKAEIEVFNKIVYTYCHDSHVHTLLKKLVKEELVGKYPEEFQELGKLYAK